MVTLRRRHPKGPWILKDGLSRYQWHNRAMEVSATMRCFLMVNGASMKMHEVNPLNEVRDWVQGGSPRGQWKHSMITRCYIIHSRLHQIPTLLLKVINALVSWCLWDDAYSMVQCRKAMMQCYQILVDWAKICDTRNNIRMTWSNGKSPKFLSEKLWSIEGKETCHKGSLVQNFALKRNHNKGPSQGGFDGRLQDYE
jgi:hypothetical protein